MENSFQQPDITEQQPDPAHSKTNFSQEVRSFYQHDFKSLLVTFFTDPLDGLYQLLSAPSAKGLNHALIIMGSVFVLFFAGSYISVGELREFMEFSNFLAIGLLPVLVMLSVAAFSYIIKLIVRGATFTHEMVTGALCGIPLALLIFIAILFRLFGEDINIIGLFQSPLSGVPILTIITIYILLMMMNVVHQSLRAGGLRAVYAWYISPIVIMVSLFVSVSVLQNIF